MQSLRIGILLGLTYACSLCYAIPLGGDQSAEAVPLAETRIIVPPELPSNYFAMQKEKSDTIASDKDSTPLHFLREVFVQNMSSPMQPTALAIEGYKQIPIYITIPIYINPSYHAQQGPDGAVITTTPLRQLIEPGDDQVNIPVSPEDVKIALKELLVDTFKESNQGRVVRKKRLNRQKKRKIYRD